jgi:hypothetical protein
MWMDPRIFIELIWIVEHFRKFLEKFGIPEDPRPNRVWIFELLKSSFESSIISKNFWKFGDPRGSQTKSWMDRRIFIELIWIIDYFQKFLELFEPCLNIFRPGPAVALKRACCCMWIPSKSRWNVGRIYVLRSRLDWKSYKAVNTTD